MAPTPFSQDPTRIMHVAVLSVFSFIALLAVIFRLWARKLSKNIWEANDYLIIIGLIWALGLSGFTMNSYIMWDLGGDATQYGSAEAIGDLVRLQSIALLVGQVTWVVAVTVIRASVLALYIRIFRTKSFRWACYVTHGVNAAFGAATILGACLICLPIAYNWDHSIAGGYCGNQKSLDLFLGIFNLLMDVTVVVLPMPVLWGLQMAVGRKIVLSMMFGLGVIICVITLIRIEITTWSHGTNTQQIFSLVALFTCLEALLGVINACLPVLKPIFSKFSESTASAWLSSVMSGTIPIFVRRSQVGSKGTDTPPSATATKKKKEPGTEKEMVQDIPRWHGESHGMTSSPPPPKYVCIKAAEMMFPSPAMNVRHSPSPSPPIQTRAPISTPPILPRGPPVPPKEDDYLASVSVANNRDRGKYGYGIRVQRAWDVESGIGEESDGRPLDGCREDNVRW